MKNKCIIISGANILTGGPLQIFRDCLRVLSNEFGNKKIIAIVGDKNLFEKASNITFIEIKNYKRFIFLKFYYEYFKYNRISSAFEVDLWLSLNDCSPLVKANKQAVYCHNATPFYKRTFHDIRYPTRVLFQSFYYSIFYRINIGSNDFLIVQQQWIKNYFKKKFNIKEERIIINNMSKNSPLIYEGENNSQTTKYTFLYPTKPQPYKNIEVICEAVKVLNQLNFQVIITIDGLENNYSRHLVEKYGNYKQIKFIGFVNRDRLEELYSNVDTLIFSSKLETWGLPLSEFASYDKDIISVDLDYAKETLGEYKKVSFFQPENKDKLASLMKNRIEKKTLRYDEAFATIYNGYYTKNLKELLDFLIYG